MKRFAIAILFCIVLVGCVYHPPSKIEFNNQTSLSMDYIRVWQNAIQTLALAGYLIKISDQQNGIITTEKKTVQLDETQADCGDLGGFSYIKDKRTVTDIALSIILKNSGQEKTEVVVNSQIEAVFNTGDTTATKKMPCTSTGVVEQDILKRLK